MDRYKPYPNTYTPEISLQEYIFEKMENYGDKTALINVKTNETVTFSTVRENSLRLANSLLKLNVKKGDVIAIYCPNMIEFVYMFYGIISAGGSCMLIGILNQEVELLHQLSQTKCKIIFTILEKVKLVQKVQLSCSTLEKIIVVGESNGCISFSTILQSECHFPKISINPLEDTALLVYSSGTTGLPKGVMLTHCNLLSTITRGSNDFTKSNIHLGLLPFYHMFGLSVFITSSMSLGIPVVCIPKFHPQEYLMAIQKYKPKTLLTVPPIAHFLRTSPLAASHDLSSVETVFCGSAPLNGSLMEAQLKQRFPNFKHLIQAYGMTETSAAVIVSVPGKPNSIGLGVSNISYKIVDPETDKDKRINEIGELCIEGPVVMKGYYNMPDVTSQTVKNGWLHTGDCAYIDSDGFVYLIDRYKEILKHKGFQVSPSEIEATLIKHPSILDAAVIGIPGEEVGELPKAFIVRKNNISEEEIKDFIKGKLAPHKWLTGGVEFIDEIPKSISGKILKRKLRDCSKKQNPSSKL